MDFLKSQFERIQQQLAGLTPSQKMLSAALVTIMVMTLWLSGRYAGTAEMEPLLGQPLAQDEMARIGMQLTAAGIDHKVAADGRLLVAADRRTMALATLGSANLMPKDFSNGFDHVIGKMTPWDGNDRQSAMFNRAKEMTLEQILSQFPGVGGAKVMIDARSVRRIGEGNIDPTATASITMRNGSAADKSLAKAVAHFVAGAHAGLSPDKVKVVIGGKLVPVQPDGGAAGGITAETTLEIQYQAEKHLTDKMRDLLSYAGDVRVAVRIKVENSAKAGEKTKYNKDESLIADQRITNRSRENTSRAASPTEAGAVTNAGASISAAAGGGERADTDTNESVESFIAPGAEKLTWQTPAGEASAAGVSVRLPRSWLAGVARHVDPAAKDPDAATISRLAAAEIAGIRNHVAAITGLTGTDAVHVDTFFDVVPPLQAVTAGDVTGITAMLGGNVKEIALGGLALVSLTMMSLMVRKGAPSPAPVPAGSPAPRQAFPSMIKSMEALVGEVSTQDPTLDGMELDDDAIRTQQMLSQVTSLVGENPDSAAQLIKRWMNQR